MKLIFITIPVCLAEIVNHLLSIGFNRTDLNHDVVIHLGEHSRVLEETLIEKAANFM